MRYAKRDSFIYVCSHAPFFAPQKYIIQARVIQAPTRKTRFAEGAGARIHNTTTTAKRSANSAAETTSRETRIATQDTRYRTWSGDVAGSDGGGKNNMPKNTTTTTTKKPEGATTTTITIRRYRASIHQPTKKKQAGKTTSVTLGETGPVPSRDSPGKPAADAPGPGPGPDPGPDQGRGRGLVRALLEGETEAKHR